MSKWIVAHDIEFYPYIEEYGTYEEAKKEYDKKKEMYEGDGDRVYIAEVKEMFD